MKIKFLGASGTVTGSSYALTSGSGQSILIDLGMFQGLPEIEKLNYEPYAYDCSQLSGVILTHAHLDHCGRLPILYSHGYTGSIWMTPPTKDLTALSLLDSAKIAKQDDKIVLYDKVLAEQTISRFKVMPYREPFQVGGFTVTFRDAGHILGSASLEIEDNHPSSELKKIIFSGDLGNTPEDLVDPTEVLDAADVVVMESTYGDALHPTDNPADIIQSEIEAVEQTGGTLLIPAFSLERSQELLHTIMHLKAEGKIQAQTSVFLDSPMAQRATDIYTQHPMYLNAHVQKELRSGSPFEFEGLQIIAGRRESEAIGHHPEAEVIIAGSGMMTGGRIVGHAARYLSMKTTRLLIVGYQGEETLGRKLQEGSSEVIIDGVTVPVRAHVSSTRAMSSHADQGQLLEWLGHIQNVKKVILTHGENKQRQVLAERIKQDLEVTDVHTPQMHEEIDF
jgi:metallo-beta-lactamase family protein